MALLTVRLGPQLATLVEPALVLYEFHKVLGLNALAKGVFKRTDIFVLVPAGHMRRRQLDNNARIVSFRVRKARRMLGFDGTLQLG
jgi:hypothetical protein